MEIGLFTFGELTVDSVTGRPLDPAARLREFVDLARLGDQAGLHVFGVGEHHRPDFAISSPPVVLAAIAQATERIRLTSTVTVLSRADPVKVFEDFATVDLLSGGRAEIAVGRGAYTESFPLFGHDLADYDALFEDKLELLLRLRDADRVTWSGNYRPPLRDAGLYPSPIQQPLPVWVAVGGNPASVVRAGRLGLPLYLAILGHPGGFVPLATLYRQAAAEAGHATSTPRVGVTSHFCVEETSQGARETFYPYYARYIGHNMPAARGQLLPRDAFEAWAGPRGALFAGSPQEVIDKILWERELARTRPLPRPDRARRAPVRRDCPFHRAACHPGAPGRAAGDCAVAIVATATLLWLDRHRRIWGTHPPAHVGFVFRPASLGLQGQAVAETSCRSYPARAARTCSTLASAHARSVTMGLRSDWPSGVSEYSTLGGLLGWTRRRTKPSRSSRRRVWVSIFCEMPPIDRRKAPKRCGPSPSSSIT
jgi:alkanesulfonate monooxygenase SsuD/methylene tetrahydromethanopterin reductase-like flavin-dependent oxidoreductase (luciferase family)